MTDGVTDFLQRQELGRRPRDEGDDGGRSQFMGRLAVPSGVAVDHHRVVWSAVAVPGVKTAWTRKRRPPRLLAEFVRLANAPEVDLEAFATNYGPLRLCGHGLPWTHRPLTDQSWTDAGCDLVRISNPELELSTRSKLRFGLVIDDPPQPLPWPVFREDLADWRIWSGRFATILRLAEALRSGKLGEADDWDVAAPPPPRNSLPIDVENLNIPRAKWDLVRMKPASGKWLPPSRAVGQHQLTLTVDEWLANGAVRPFLTWSGDGSPVLVFGGESPMRWSEGGELFGALAWELALAVGRRPLRTVTCSGCGLPYVPFKMPARTQRYHYCPECRANGVPARDRKRRQRSKEESSDGN